MTGPRRGFTLIELMIVMTIAAFVLGLSAAWIHQSLFAASTMRDRSRHHQSLVRLSKELRDSVHSGTSMSVDGRTLVVQRGDDTEVAFRISDRAIEMQTKDMTGSNVSRERYTLSQNALAVWEISELPQRVSLVVYRPSQLTGKSQSKSDQHDALIDHPVDLCVRAAVGRWDKLGIQRRPNQ